MRRTMGVVLGLALAGSAGAAGPVGLDAARRALAGSDEAAAVAAAQTLATSNEAKATDAVLDALAVGANPKVAVALLDVLEKRRDPRALETLGRYARNRNSDVRKKALAALGALPGDAPVTLLIAGLSDSSEEVRAAAAGELGKRRDRRAVEPLVKLLGRKDVAAANALGQLGSADVAHRLGELIGQVPDALLATALGDMLKRPDFGPENVRLEVVKALGRIPGADSTGALVEYVARSEKDPSRPSRGEAQHIVDQRSAP